MTYEAEVLRRLPSGHAHAVSSRQLASEIGCSRRTVGQAVAALIEQAHVIGSTCDGPNAGYFICSDLDDLAIGTAHIIARAKRSFVRVAALRRAASAQFSEVEVLHLFALEEVSA